MAGEILPGVEGPDTDDDGIQRAQLVRDQISAGQLRDRIAHALQASGHVVTRAGQVTDVTASNRQIKGNRLQARDRLEQLKRNVVVTKLDALSIEPHATDLHAALENSRGELGWGRDGEGEPGVLPCRGQMKWL